MLLNFVKPVASNVVMSASGISQEFLEDIDSYEGKIYYTYDTIEDISFTIEDLETKTVNGEKMYDLSLRIESPKIELMLDKQNEENIFEVTLSESEYLESLELKNDKFNIAYYVMYTVISINGKREIIMESKAVHSFEDNYEKITDSTLDDYVFEFKKNLEKYINKESSKEELFVNYLEEESYKELNEKINNDKFFALLIKTFLSSDIYKYHSKFELPN